MRNLLLLTTLLAVITSFGQTVTTFAGKSNGDPTTNYESRTSNVDLDSTYFAYPNGICIDPSGRFFVTERNKLRMLTGGKAFIRAGNPGGPTSSEGYSNATGTQASFRNPGGLVANSDGDLFICDAENHCIRKVTKFVNTSNPQAVTTFAGASPSGFPGSGTSGSSDGTGTSARFNQPQGICVDTNGNFYVADYLNFTIRKITPAGVVTTIAGKAEVEGTTDNSNGSMVRFGGPWGIAMLDDNNLVVTDPWNTNIRKVNISSGATTTIAGPTSGSNAQHKDGSLTEARFRSPKGVVVISGIIYVADVNTIRAIDIANNTVSTFAGDKDSYGLTDGQGTSAKFTEMDGMVSDGKGNMYVCENSGLVASHVIRKIAVNSLEPAVDFTVTKRNLVIDEKTVMTNNSGGAPADSFSWTITPGTYSVHSGGLDESSVELSFSVTGFYTVNLFVSNQYGSDSEEKDAYINVSSTGSISQYSESNLLKVYPNPAANRVNFELDPSFTMYRTEMSVYAQDGQLMYKGTYLPYLDLSAWQAGMYYVILESDGKQAAKRFLHTN